MIKKTHRPIRRAYHEWGYGEHYAREVELLQQHQSRELQLQQAQEERH
jgi:hypothetical protein